MPMFYFNVNGPAFHWTDLVGRRCHDLAAVHREARRIAADVISSSLLAGRIPDEAIIEVEDENMRPVLEMPLSHAGC